METLVLLWRSATVRLDRACRMTCTPNKITLLRVAVGFLAVGMFGRRTWLNLLAVVLTGIVIVLDGLDGYIARKNKLATPEGAQIDILGDRMIENMYFTYFAVAGMVSLWLPLLFFVRGATTDFLRALALKAGYSGWGMNGMAENRWVRTLVASRWSRGLYAAMKCLCFCYLGLELALTRGPVALVPPVAANTQMFVRAGAHSLAWATAVFCILRGLPVFFEGAKYFRSRLPGKPVRSSPPGDAL